MATGLLDLKRLYQYRKLPFHLARDHPVAKPVRPGYCFLRRMFFSRCDGGLSLWGITRQEHLAQDPNRMFRLPGLPFSNAPAFPQVSQKGFDILPGPVLQWPLLQKTVKFLCPPDIEPRGQNPWSLDDIPSNAKTSESHPPMAKSAEPRASRPRSVRLPFAHPPTVRVHGLQRRRIVGRTLRRYPVLLRAPPVSFPKALFGIVEIHDFHPQYPFNFNR